jgi:tetratricopeptide (TPR) repeat protein
MSDLKTVVELCKSSRFSEAKRLCSKLCHGEFSADARAWDLLSKIHLRLGAAFDAESCSRRAIELGHFDAGFHLQLGITLLLQHKDAEAVTVLETAIATKPDLADAYIQLSHIYNRQGAVADSARILERAHIVMPEDVNISCLLAEAKEKSNDVETSLALTEEILAFAPLHPVANIVRARLDFRRGSTAAARTRLAHLVNNVTLGDTNLSHVQYLLGKIYDRLGDYDAAFTAFEAANTATARIHGTTYRGGIMLDRIHRYKGAISKESIRHWRKSSPASTGRDPVFLVSFPRSGTTLTEQILASHSRIVTSDERPLLQQTCERLLSNRKAGAGFPYTLDRLTKSEIAGLRDYYLQLARSSVSTETATKVFIDKLPLNIIEIGIIKRLFSNPRFICLLRHPRDICLSCFMQSFTVNHAMANFFTLEDTARFYAATMNLWLHYNDVFDLDVIQLRYEDLVTNTRPEIGRLLDFLGLDWEDGLLDYRLRGERAVSTPSYQDIGSPIFKRAINRWKSYEDKLSRVESILDPFIKQFGYQECTLDPSD